MGVLHKKAWTWLDCFWLCFAHTLSRTPDCSGGYFLSTGENAFLRAVCAISSASFSSLTFFMLRFQTIISTKHFRPCLPVEKWVTVNDWSHVITDPVASDVTLKNQTVLQCLGGHPREDGHPEKAQWANPDSSSESTVHAGQVHTAIQASLKIYQQTVFENFHGFWLFLSWGEWGGTGRDRGRVGIPPSLT